MRPTSHIVPGHKQEYRSTAMKRDMDLVRKLLLALEERQASESSLRTLPGVDDATVWYHLRIMKEAGLIEAAVSTSKQAGYVPRVTAYWLTWDGHEFLDATREESMWNRVKQAGKDAGAFSFRTLRDTAIALATAAVKKKLKL